MRPPVVDKKLVAHVAALANIELTDGEAAYYEQQLGKILEHVAQLAGMPDPLGPDWRGDTARPPMPERPDAVRPSLPADVAVAAAPETKGSAFLVPRIIE